MTAILTTTAPQSTVRPGNPKKDPLARRVRPTTWPGKVIRLLGWGRNARRGRQMTQAGYAKGHGPVGTYQDLPATTNEQEQTA